jgi:hypothetical protein
VHEPAARDCCNGPETICDPAALNDVIRDTDQAVLTYPHGSVDSGASAMRVRIYGKQATE